MLGLWGGRLISFVDSSGLEWTRVEWHAMHRVRWWHGECSGVAVVGVAIVAVAAVVVGYVAVAVGTVWDGDRDGMVVICKGPHMTLPLFRLPGSGIDIALQSPSGACF